MGQNARTCLHTNVSASIYMYSINYSKHYKENAFYVGYCVYRYGLVPCLTDSESNYTPSNFTLLVIQVAVCNCAELDTMSENRSLSYDISYHRGCSCECHEVWGKNCESDQMCGWHHLKHSFPAHSMWSPLYNRVSAFAKFLFHIFQCIQCEGLNGSKQRVLVAKRVAQIPISQMWAELLSLRRTKCTLGFSLRALRRLTHTPSLEGHQQHLIAQTLCRRTDCGTPEALA